MANPIWKDYLVDLGNAAAVTYRIVTSEEVIFTGRAFKRPGASTIKVKINGICANYLHNNTDKFATLISETFSVQTLSGPATWTTTATVEFTPDWSYDPTVDELDGLSLPINGRIDPRQLVLYSTSESGVSVVFDDLDEYVETENNTIRIDCKNYPSFETLVINTNIYKVVPACHRFVLYYKNALGGWDSLLIEGNHTITDNISRFNNEVEYDNNDLSARGRKTYAEEMVTALSLTTGWMSDNESAMMHHLLESTDVYLHDLVTDIISPVILTDSTMDVKTYKSNGNRLVNYTISCELANTKTRK